MLTRAYTIRFNTPAFLGNADQDGQWRTPPIKALLRQWWRVAFAADQTGAVDMGAMRAAEGKLFGVAADRDGDSRKSEVRIRLNRWDKGSLSSWTGQEQGVALVTHREVKRNGQVTPVSSQLYLGYGPLKLAQGQTSLKARAAIQAVEHAVLSLAIPSGAEEATRLDTALSLMHRYGTLGGRSRNGWGSFSLTPIDASTPELKADLDARLTSHWQDALGLDWPHAIGTDVGSDGKQVRPLIWQTEALVDWKAVMRRLAEIKISLRVQFIFPDVQPPHPQPLARHWLAYPITKHATLAWDRNARLPNSLRFKVRADADGKLRGVIFHVPCLPPPQFKPNLAAIQTVWRQVHAHLDHADRKLTRIPA